MLSPAPSARRTDPGTSHAAAASAEPGADTCRARVLAVLRDHPSGLTHQELVKEMTRRAHSLAWPRYTDSGIRTRCKELEDARLVTTVPDRYGRTSSGRKSLYWRALAPGELPPAPQDPQDALDLGL